VSTKNAKDLLLFGKLFPKFWPTIMGVSVLKMGETVCVRGKRGDTARKYGQASELD
jgi:hypothetical protein